MTCSNADVVTVAVAVAVAAADANAGTTPSARPIVRGRSRKFRDLFECVRRPVCRKNVKPVVGSRKFLDLLGRRRIRRVRRRFRCRCRMSKKNMSITPEYISLILFGTAFVLLGRGTFFLTRHSHEKWIRVRVARRCDWACRRLPSNFWVDRTTGRIVLGPKAEALSCSNAATPLARHSHRGLIFDEWNLSLSLRLQRSCMAQLPVVAACKNVDNCLERRMTGFRIRRRRPP